MSEAAKPGHWPGTRNNVWQRTRGGATPGCQAWPGAGSTTDTGHAFPHFPQDEPFSGSLRVRAEVRTHLGMQLTFREMTSSLPIPCDPSVFGSHSLLLRSYFNNVILRSILGELQPTPPQANFPCLLGHKMLHSKGMKVGPHALEVSSKVEMAG